MFRSRRLPHMKRGTPLLNHDSDYRTIEGNVTTEVIMTFLSIVGLLSLIAGVTMISGYILHYWRLSS